MGPGAFGEMTAYPNLVWCVSGLGLDNRNNWRRDERSAQCLLDLISSEGARHATGGDLLAQVL